MKPVFIFFRRHHVIGVVIAFSALTLLMTYPMIFHLDFLPYNGSERIAPGADVFLPLWEMWWLKQAILNLKNPFFSTYIFYPSGSTLYFTLTILLNAILSLVMQPFLGLIQIYNLLLLFTIIISGLGAYLLIGYLLEDRQAAFIGSIIFAFTPYLLVHLQHMEVCSLQWIPFFILYFLKMLNEDGYRNSFLSGLFFSATFYSDLNYSILLGITSILILAYHPFTAPPGGSRRSAILKYLFMLCICTLLTGPYLFGLFRFYLSGNTSVSLTIQSPISQSLDLSSFILPSFMHPLFGAWVEPVYRAIATFGKYKISGYTELVGYIGFIPLFLALLSMKYRSDRSVRLWLIIWVASAVLSLGPALKVLGIVTIPASRFHIDKIATAIQPDLDPIAVEMLKNSIGIPMPYLAWHFIPILNGNESPARFFAIVILSVSVLSGYGLQSVFSFLKTKSFWGLSLRPLVSILLTVGVLFEYISVPIPMKPIDIPPFYKKIKSSPEVFSVVDVPLLLDLPENDPFINRSKKTPFYSIHSGLAMYYQTFHGKHIPVGILGRWPKSVNRSFLMDPFIRALTRPLTDSDNRQNATPGGLIQNRFKYIVIHKKFLKTSRIRELCDFLNTTLHRPVHQDSLTIAYQLY